MPDPYDDGERIRRKYARERTAAEARYQRDLGHLVSRMQRRILEDHPRPSPRRHPAGLIAPPPTILPARGWVRIVARQIARVLRWWADGLRGLARARVTRGELGHSRKEE